MSYYKGEAILWYDLETSGLFSDRHDIIQIAAIATTRTTLEIIEEFECKLQFNHTTATFRALENNSYVAEIWETAAVPQNTAFHLFDAFLQKYRTWKRISKKSGTKYDITELGGHNLQFDNDFLKEFYRKNTDSNWTSTSAWRGGYIDTLDIAKTVQIMSGERWEDGFQLGVLCKRFDVELVDAHDALADVKATIELYKKLRDTIVIDDRHITSGMDPKETLGMGAFTEPSVATESINDR